MEQLWEQCYRLESLGREWGFQKPFAALSTL